MNNYKELDKILHRQFLGDSDLSNYLFKRLFKSSKQINSNIQKIFVTGLARSGTTALLNLLFNSPNCTSLQYKHMPFVLSPRLASFFGKLQSESSSVSKPFERAHGDGILISNQSPECLDEIFWIKNDPNYFIKPISSDFKYSESSLKAYGNFLNKHSALSNSNKIIIKNNNNHIRLPNLAKFFKSDIFLVLFRDPLFQSISLLNTHKRLCKLQQDDPFILEYMNLIGHREFGLNHKPYEYSDFSSVYSISDKNYSIDSLNYWLKIWIRTYEWLLDFSKTQNYENIMFISYEDICNQDSVVLKNILAKVDIKSIDRSKLINKNKPKSEFICDKGLLSNAKEIYCNLKEISFS